MKMGDRPSPPSRVRHNIHPLDSAWRTNRTRVGKRTVSLQVVSMTAAISMTPNGFQPSQLSGPETVLGLITEFEFTLPRGLVDQDGQVHRTGLMRLSTARDELLVQKDRRVQNYAEYGTLVLLSLVITRLGSVEQVTPELLEGLFSPDLTYLKEVYNRLNQQGNLHVPALCPHCAGEFQVELSPPGE